MEIDIRCEKLKKLREHFMPVQIEGDSGMRGSEFNKSDCTELTKLRQNEFAHLVGVDQSNYSKYENGKKIPSILILARVALKCGVELDYFFNEQNPEDARQFFVWRNWIYRLYKTTAGQALFSGIPQVIEALELKDSVDRKQVTTEHIISKRLFEN